jgi:hypothetical protein
MHYDHEGKSNILSVHAMKKYGGAKVYLHSFLTLALDGVSSQLQAQAAVPLQRKPLVPTE